MVISNSDAHDIIRALRLAVANADELANCASGAGDNNEAIWFKAQASNYKNIISRLRHGMEVANTKGRHNDGN